MFLLLVLLVLFEPDKKKSFELSFMSRYVNVLTV